MILRIIGILILMLMGWSLGYVAMTRVVFRDQRASVSPLYCRLFGKDRALSKPVIFIPGIKGSLLTQDGTQKWLTLSQLLFNTEPLLSRKTDATLEGTGILTRLSLIPGILEYAPYQRINAALACNPKSYFFSYDWRRAPQENALLLTALVERVRRETGEKPSLVAHSMGGLITHAYLKEHADTIDKIVYVGVPFQSGVGFLRDIDEGSPVGLNKTILSKEAIFSHPSSYALLPHQGQRLYKKSDLLALETWKKFRLSVFRDGVVDEDLFQEHLTQAIAFHRVLDTPTSFTNRFLLVLGNCQPTVKAVEEDGSLTMSPGDSRVLETAAYPVEAETMNKEVIFSCAPHDQQLNDRVIIDQIFRFLRS